MKSITLNQEAADKIKKLIRDINTTQEEFAYNLGVSSRTLQNWLAQKTSIPIDKLDIIQKELCVSIEGLFGVIPAPYRNKKITALQTMAKLVNPSFFKRAITHYKRYVDWVHERMHSNPYPTTGFFHIFEKTHNSKTPHEYYNRVSAFISSNVNETKFTIGYVVPIDRMRIDYGYMVLKENKIEVTRVFVGNSITSYIHLDDYHVNEGFRRIDIITWVSEEHSIFVIGNEFTNFSIKNHGMVSLSEQEEKEIEAGNHAGTVIFPKSAWHKRPH